MHQSHGAEVDPFAASASWMDGREGTHEKRRRKRNVAGILEADGHKAPRPCRRRIQDGEPMEDARVLSGGRCERRPDASDGVSRREDMRLLPRIRRRGDGRVARVRLGLRAFPWCDGF